MLSFFSPSCHISPNSFSIDPQLVDVDVVAALDLYVEQGQWDKCIETATKQVLLSIPIPSSSVQVPWTPHLSQSSLSYSSTPKR